MNYYVISDTHFNHKKLIKENIRVFDYEDRIIKSLNNIRDNDIFIHLGDITIGHGIDFNHILSFYKFKKYLVRGNHDDNSIKWYYEQGWDFVADSFSLNIYGKELLFTHKPIRINEGQINIHGHVHSPWREKDYEGFEYHTNHINVTPEVIGYNVVSLKSILGI